MSYGKGQNQSQSQRRQPATVITAMRSKNGKWLKLTVGEVSDNGYVPLSRFVLDFGKVGAVMSGALDKLTVAELKDKQP